MDRTLPNVVFFIVVVALFLFCFVFKEGGGVLSTFESLLCSVLPAYPVVRISVIHEYRERKGNVGSVLVVPVNLYQPTSRLLAHCFWW